MNFADNSIVVDDFLATNHLNLVVIQNQEFLNGIFRLDA